MRNFIRPNANENRIKRIKHEYCKQIQMFAFCNDACNMYVTASNRCNNNIRARVLFIVFTYLVGDFINVFLVFSLFFPFLSSLSLVSWGFSQFHLFKSHLFFGYQQYGRCLIQDVFLDVLFLFFFFCFFSRFFHLEYKLVACFEWVDCYFFFTWAF